MSESSEVTPIESGTPERNPSERIVEAVADAEGVDPLELPPLYDAVDPDAVDSLFAPQLRVGSVPSHDAAVRFEYHGYVVRVAATGRISLTGR